MNNNALNKKNYLLKLQIVVFWLLIWQLLAMLIGQEVLFASPIHVVKRFLELIIDPQFIKDIINSLLHILLGFFWAFFFAIALAYISKRFENVYRYLSPLFIFIKSTPVAAFILMAFLLFGSQGLSTFISFLMALPILYTNITDGLLSVPKPMLDAAKIYNMSEASQWKYIYIPHASPFLLSGCSVSLGLAWKSGIAAEVIGIARHSLGEHLYDAKLYLDTPQLFAITLIIVCLSWACEKIIMFSIKHVMSKFF